MTFHYQPPRQAKLILASPDLRHLLFQRLMLRGDCVPWATFTEPDILSEDVANKIHDFNSDTFRWAFSNTAPVLGSTFLLSNITQIATGGGYTQVSDGAGGLVPTLSFSRSGQTTTVANTQTVLTASGAVATFRYLILVNDTPTSPLNPVVGWLDHGAGVTMAATDTYTIPAANLFTIN